MFSHSMLCPVIIQHGFERKFFVTLITGISLLALVVVHMLVSRAGVIELLPTDFTFHFLVSSVEVFINRLNTGLFDPAYGALVHPSFLGDFDTMCHSFECTCSLLFSTWRQFVDYGIITVRVLFKVLLGTMLIWSCVPVTAIAGSIALVPTSFGVVVSGSGNIFMGV